MRVVYVCVSIAIIYLDSLDLPHVAACPGVFVHKPTVKKCYAVQNSWMSRNNTVAYCKNLDNRSHLVVVRSAAENVVIADILKNGNC